MRTSSRQVGPIVVVGGKVAKQHTFKLEQGASRRPVFSQLEGPFAEGGAKGKSRIPAMWSKSTLIVWL